MRQEAVSMKRGCISPNDFEQFQFLKNVGDIRLQKKIVLREVVIEREVVIPTRKPETTSLLSKIKSAQLEDSFLRDIIPTEKDPTAIEKLWGIGRSAFKSRKEILEDAWVE